jgi:hypothetical protein
VFSLSALIGYAIGTAQVLLLDWVRERRGHRQSLRLLLAELLRLEKFDHQYNWKLREVPESDAIPKPPVISPTFVSAIAATDWSLTDEYSNDNSHASIITLVDLCDTLKFYHSSIDELIAKVRAPAGREEALTLLDRAVKMSQSYDREADQFHYCVVDTIRDVRRRLAESTLRKQFKRIFKRLTVGDLDPAVSPTDPRVVGYIAQRKRSRSQ